MVGRKRHVTNLFKTLVNKFFPGKPGCLLTSNGFTLLEIMLAIAILSIAAIMILRAQADSMRLYEESDKVTRGIYLARQLIVEMETENILNMGQFEGTFDKPDDEFRYVKIVEETGLPGLVHLMVTTYHDNREIITIHVYSRKQAPSE